MNDKFVQLIERLWDLNPVTVAPEKVTWSYKGYNIELFKYDKYYNFHIVKDYQYLICVQLDISETRFLTWKLNHIKAYDKFCNNLLDTLLEEDDASCFDDLLETNKNE